MINPRFVLGQWVLEKAVVKVEESDVVAFVVTWFPRELNPTVLYSDSEGFTNFHP